MLNYDSFKNEVVITGCSTCPFLKDNSFDSVIYDPTCSLVGEVDGVITKQNGWSIFVHDTFPKDCPIKKPDFKLTKGTILMANKPIHYVEKVLAEDLINKEVLFANHKEELGFYGILKGFSEKSGGKFIVEAKYDNKKYVAKWIVKA